MTGHLVVGLSEDETEVVVNLPYQADNGTGWTHVTFSREQAENFARLVLRKAAECNTKEPFVRRRPVTVDAMSVEPGTTTTVAIAESAGGIWWKSATRAARMKLMKEMGFGDYKAYASYRWQDFQPHSRLEITHALAARNARTTLEG
jgi:hypothetical protein